MQVADSANYINWQKIAEGDEAEFRKMFHAFNKKLYPFAIKIVKLEQEAEEIIQEVFIKVWENRQSIAAMQNPGGYIYTMGSNTALNSLKKIANQSQLRAKLMTKINEEQNEAEELLTFKESNTLVNKLVDLLPPQRKLVYLLSREEGLSYDEIASQLNISRNTVKNQLIDALKFLRAELKKADRNIPISLFLLLKGW